MSSPEQSKAWREKNKEHISQYSAHIDHDHKTGEVRGIICNRCNMGIGHLGDNPEIVKKALKWLGGVS